MRVTILYLKFLFVFLNFSFFYYLQAIIDDIKDNKPQKDIINDVRDLSVKNLIPEHEVITIVSCKNLSINSIIVKLKFCLDLDDNHVIGRMEQERRIGC